MYLLEFLFTSYCKQHYEQCHVFILIERKNVFMKLSCLGLFIDLKACNCATIENIGHK